MKRPKNLSPRLKRYLVRNAAAFVVMWFFIFPILLFSRSWGAMLMIGILYGYSRYEASEEKKLKDEIDQDGFSFRHFRYRSVIWVYWIIMLPHLALAVLLNNTFIWVITCMLAVIGGAFLLHEWTEVKELEPTEAADASSNPVKK